jgi:hypothetical protein
MHKESPAVVGTVKQAEMALPHRTQHTLLRLERTFLCSAFSCSLVIFETQSRYISLFHLSLELRSLEAMDEDENRWCCKVLEVLYLLGLAVG